MAGFNKEDLKPIKKYKAMVKLMTKRIKTYSRDAHRPHGIKVLTKKEKPKFKVDGSVEVGYTYIAGAVEPRQLSKTYGFTIFGKVCTNGRIYICFTYRGLKQKKSLFHKTTSAEQDKLDAQLITGIELNKATLQNLQSSINMYNEQNNILTAEIDCGTKPKLDLCFRNFAYTKEELSEYLIKIYECLIAPQTIALIDATGV